VSTFLELVQDLRRECRVSGNGPVSVTATDNEEYTRLIEWTKQAWLSIQRANRFWRFMRRSAACPTVQGQALYSAADFGISSFGHWALDYDNGDTFRSYANPQVSFDIANSRVQLVNHGLSNGDTVKLFTDGALPGGLTAATQYYAVNGAADTLQLSTSAGGSAIVMSGSATGTTTMTSGNTTSFIGLIGETPLGPMDYDLWRDTYQFGATRITYSRPVAISLAPNNSVAAGPVAAAGYTLVGDYYMQPTALVADADVPGMPEQFHMAIVYRAMQYYGASEAAPEVYDAGVLEYNRIFQSLANDQAPRMRLAGALC
jgi:hypothetical protein